MATNVKQVIVMRNDLGMRKGKMIAQGAHASMLWLINRIKDRQANPQLFSQEEERWINDKFTKICVKVNSEEELHSIYNKAKELGLTVELVTDCGLTEFHGKPTDTCLCIGPHEAEKIDIITKDLSLL